MNKKILQNKQKYNLLTITILAVIIAVVCGWVGYYTGTQKNAPNKVPSQNRAGYVIGEQATEQVANFYNQYIRSHYTAEQRERFIEAYGSKT